MMKKKPARPPADKETTVFPQHPQTQPCPSCGHCPTCGRGGVRTAPYVFPYPYVNPTWPIITVRTDHTTAAPPVTYGTFTANSYASSAGTNVLQNKVLSTFVA